MLKVNDDVWVLHKSGYKKGFVSNIENGKCRVFIEGSYGDEVIVIDKKFVKPYADKQ